MILGLLVVGITGAVLHGNTLYTWGDRLMAWMLPKLRSHTLAIPTQPAVSGCLDQEGVGLFLQEGDSAGLPQSARLERARNRSRHRHA